MNEIIRLIELNQKLIDKNLEQISQLEKQIQSIKETNQKYATQINEMIVQLK